MTNKSPSHHTRADADVSGVCKICEHYAHESVWADIYGIIDSPRGPGLWWERAEVLAADIPDEYVWTIIDGNDGNLYASAGWHWVNRVAYVVTREPYPYFALEVLLDD